MLLINTLISILALNIIDTVTVSGCVSTEFALIMVAAGTAGVHSPFIQ